MRRDGLEWNSRNGEGHHTRRESSGLKLVEDKEATKHMRATEQKHPPLLSLHTSQLPLHLTVLPNAQGCIVQQRILSVSINLLTLIGCIL